MIRRDFLARSGAAAAGLGVGFFAGRRSIFPTSRYVQIGTSITAGITPNVDGRVPMVVASQLGMEGLTAGFGGACAGDHKFPDMDPVSLFALSNAIVSGDWSIQMNSGRRDPAITTLMLAGFDRGVSHVGLEYGTNDFRYDRPIGLVSDQSRTTFIGALNHSIQALIGRYPKIRVFLITPWWMPTFDNRDSDEHANEAGHFLRDYVHAMRSVAEQNRVPWLDLWNNSGVNKHNYRSFTTDGVHLNDAGAFRRIELTAGFIRSLF